MIKIAILLSCYQPEKIVDRALSQINIQTKKNNIIVYMINDCSPNTKDEYQSLIQKYSNLNIKYFKTEKNSGPCRVRNFGLKQIKEQYVIFHDDDDWLYNEYVIENYINEIKKHQNFSLIKMGFIEQLDSEKAIIHADKHFLCLGILYNKNFLDKYNIRFNEKLLWRYEDYYLTHEILYKSNFYKYKIIELNNFIGYVHYHDHQNESLTWKGSCTQEELLNNNKFGANLLYDTIFFSEKVRFYSNIQNISYKEQQNILNILNHFYINANTIFFYLHKYNAKIFTKEELTNFYNSVIFLINTIDKNLELIKKNTLFYDAGEDYQAINYYFFKKNFKSEFNQWIQ